MRITGGRARSIPLQCPKGNKVRPATDRMRESVFSSLGALIEGAAFLDLFAGVGSYGLEAISRGAAEGVFVEKDRDAIKNLRQNLGAVLKSTGITDKADKFSIQSVDVLAFLDRNLRNHSDLNLVFIDPPYHMVAESYLDILEKLKGCFGSNKSVWVVLETPGEIDRFPTGFDRVKGIGKGREDTRCILLRYEKNSD